MTFNFRSLGAAAMLHFALATALLLSPMTGELATQDMVTPDVIAIAEGAFVAGSDQAEREAAYFLDEAAYGHDRTRQFGWYDRERNRVSI
jgi:hypothetical protein